MKAIKAGDFVQLNGFAIWHRVTHVEDGAFSAICGSGSYQAYAFAEVAHVVRLKPRPKRMTRKEAIAWLRSQGGRYTLDFDPGNPVLTYSAWVPTWASENGRTLVEAVTKLRAKVEGKAP